jgi:hypothetical protein
MRLRIEGTSFCPGDYDRLFNEWFARGLARRYSLVRVRAWTRMRMVKEQ